MGQAPPHPADSVTVEAEAATPVADQPPPAPFAGAAPPAADNYRPYRPAAPVPTRRATTLPGTHWRAELVLLWEDLWYGRWGKPLLLLALLALVGGVAIARASSARVAVDTPPTATLPALGAAAPLAATATIGPPTAVAATTAPVDAPTGLLVFHSAHETPGALQLYLLPLGGATMEARRIPGTPRHAAHPRLSPDGTRIAFAGRDAGDDDLYLIGLDGTGLVRLTSGRGNNRFPAWSPDGKQLAFGSDRDGNWEIYRRDLDAGTETRLTSDPADDNLPVWSPDGQWLAFQSDRARTMHLYKLRAAGGTPTQLTFGPANDRYPAWSPDGRRLAFYSDRAGGQDQLFAVDSESLQTNRLSVSAGRDQLPTWSRDGRWLAFASEREGTWGLYLLNLADASERPLLRQRDIWAPDWGGTR